MAAKRTSCMFLRSGVVSQARGSAYIEMQRTKVTCAVYGPRESSRQQEFSQKGKLTCEFKFAPFSCWQRRQQYPGFRRERVFLFCCASLGASCLPGIHDKDIVAILHLLVALARHFECPQKLPSGVTINTVIVQKKGGILLPQKVVQEITEVTKGEDDEGKPERDAFNALFDNAPEKLNVVKKSLQSFVNKHLSKLSLEVDNIDSQFHDGVYLIFLLGLLEGFLVPLYQYYITPANKDQKLHNVALAIDLMRDSGMKFHAKPEDVVQKDLKSTLRILYSLFQKYKNMK